MSTGGDFIQILEVGTSPSGKTKVFVVRTRYLMAPVALGRIEWYSKWRRYVFKPYEVESLFDATCLTVITDKLTQLMAERKAAKSGDKS